MFAKYYENPTMLSRVTAKNVGDVLFETHCTMHAESQTREAYSYALLPLPHNLDFVCRLLHAHARSFLALSNRSKKYQSFLNYGLFRYQSISLYYIVYAPLKRATKLIPELYNKPYRERLKILNLPTLKYNCSR